MNVAGIQLARAMSSIHELNMRQAAQDPGCLLSDRTERRAVFRQRERRTFCRIGRFLVRTGLRLQEYGLARQLPQGSAAAQR